MNEEVRRLIIDMAERHGVDPRLVAAMAEQESGFDMNAVGPTGDHGLLQVTQTAIDDLIQRGSISEGTKVEEMDPYSQAEAGVRFLKSLTDRYGNTTMALAAYNWGPGRIDRRLRRGTLMPKVYPALVLEAYTAHHERSS